MSTDSQRTKSRGASVSIAIAAGLAACLLVSSCSWFAGSNPDYNPTAGHKRDWAKGETVLGGEGLSMGLGGDPKAAPGSESAALGVNSFLWRAALDTISFMPLASADPFGGVLITDWYQPPESPTERFKLNVYILAKQLRADGIKASVFRQRLHPSGTWIDAPVTANTATDLENTILTRARQLRIASAETVGKR